LKKNYENLHFDFKRKEKKYIYPFENKSVKEETSFTEIG